MFQVAHVSLTIELATLESMVGMIEVPQVISFSSDELPSAGIKHNQPLFITVQYQNFCTHNVGGQWSRLKCLPLMHNKQARIQS